MTSLRLTLPLILLASSLIQLQAEVKFGVLANFGPTPTSNNLGGDPEAALLQGSDGNFYGTTFSGFSAPQGTIFKITPTGLLTTLATFDGSNGCNPPGALILGKDGNFYGTTVTGTIFKMKPEGVLTVLASLYQIDGSTPYAGLILGTDGNFYGTASDLYSVGDGLVFKMTPKGILTVVASFNGTNGSKPETALIQGSDGNFYGTTTYGGASNDGTIFKVTRAGVLTSLVSFAGTNGSNPQASLIQATDGNFYGTTSQGGATGNGTIFKMTPKGVLTTLISFSGANGSIPMAALLQASDGNFYGTTSRGGGSSLNGTVFKLTPAGVLTTLANFDGMNGVAPHAPLIQAKDGNLYGTTSSGGFPFYSGVVYEIALTPPQAQTILFPPVGTVRLGQTVALTATASSTLPVTYRVVSGPATISGNNVTFTGVGTVKLVAEQAGSLNYKAVEVTTTVVVGPATQTLMPFNIIPTQGYPSTPFTITPPVASSGLPVTVTVKSGPATISGYTITLTGKGAVTLTATQAGNVDYTAAPPVTTSFGVVAAQTITFPAHSPVEVGQGVTLTATASSGLPVTYQIISGPASLEVGALNSQLVPSGVGTVVLEADQAGDATYAVAQSVQQSITVNKGPQTITFPAIGNQTVGAVVTLQATSTSGVPVTFAVSGPATLSGTTLTATGAGTVYVRANAIGNTNYNAAPPVTQKFTVSN